MGKPHWVMVKGDHGYGYGLQPEIPMVYPCHCLTPNAFRLEDVWNTFVILAKNT